MSMDGRCDLVKKLMKNFDHPDPETMARMEHGPELFRKGKARIMLVNADGTPYQGEATVKFRQLSHEFDFGCNGFMLGGFTAAEQNKMYEDAFKKLFNLMVIPFYWKDFEPAEGERRYADPCREIARRPPPDRLLDFCEKNGITPKGHLLVYAGFMPPWIRRATDAELKRYIERHVRDLAERYGDRIANWDVVNEVTYREPAQTVPEDFALYAFDLARKYFPESCRFNYNDGNLWRHHQGPYTPDNMLINWLLATGRRVDSVGVQYHQIGVDRVEDALTWWGEEYLNPEHIMETLDVLAKPGIPLAISEITVMSRADMGAGNFTYQEKVTEFLYRMWFAHQAVNGIIWWNLNDGGALGPENKSDGGLLDQDLRPKPVYRMLDKLINQEWKTAESISYQPDAKNYFRGFFGKYDIEITTPDGKVTRTSEPLIKGRKNILTLKIG